MKILGFSSKSSEIFSGDQEKTILQNFCEFLLQGCHTTFPKISALT